jgi:hypothetical protein
MYVFNPNSNSAATKGARRSSNDGEFRVCKTKRLATNASSQFRASTVGAVRAERRGKVPSLTSRESWYMPDATDSERTYVCTHVLHKRQAAPVSSLRDAVNAVDVVPGSFLNHDDDCGGLSARINPFRNPDSQG